VITLPVFNVQRAINNPNSNDRAVLNQNASDALFATGLAFNILGWNIDKAEAIGKAIGADLEVFVPPANIYGKVIGVAGVVIDATQFIIGVYEDGFDWEDDGANLAQVVLGGVGLVAAGMLCAPWIAVATGTVSLGIAVYTEIRAK
jgi:hypothetical protein